MKGSNEARVGGVVLLSLAALGGGYVFLTGQRKGGDTYRVVVKSGVASIRPGSDVLLRGVKIGEVRQVALDPTTQNPLLTLAIKQDEKTPIRLLRNYAYTIRAGSFIGENYVDIRGDYDAQNPSFQPDSEKPNDLIVATAPGGFNDLTAQVGTLSADFQKTLARFDKTLDSLNSGVLSAQMQLKMARALEGVAKLTNQASQSFSKDGIKFGLGDAQAQRALRQTLKNTAAASRQASQIARNVDALTNNAGRLTNNLNGVVDENRSQLRSLLGNFSTTAKNISGLTEGLSFVVNKGGFKENSQIAFRSLRRAAENVEVGTQSLRNLGDAKTQATLRETITSIRDATGALRDTAVTVRNAVGAPENQKQLGQTLNTLSQTAQSLRSTVENLNEVSQGLKNVVADPQVQSNLKETVANLNGTLVATRAAAERVNGLLGGKKSRQTATSTATPSDGKSSTRSESKTLGDAIPTGVDFTLRHQNKSDENGGKTFGDLTFNANLFDAPFRLGVADVGEGSKLTLQTGKYLGRNAALRYGLYRGKLGVGAEVRKGRFSLEGNLYDPNRRSYNAYLGYAITSNLEILAGQEKRGGVRGASIAVRLRP